jgi:flagellar hook-associated protein 1 FlgK
MSDIFNLGASALNSLQRAISTTGNNIANANTDGYSRQEVEFASRTPNRIGGVRC